MMCSSSTSLHALRRGRLAAGESVAVIGIGGLGISAVQLAQALGAAQVFAIDLDAAKLDVARRFGATIIQAGGADVVQAVRDATNGRGVDVALELIGVPETMQQAVRMLAVHGRAAIAGLSRRSLTLDAYHELLGPETEIVGVNDHLLAEMPLLIEFARSGRLDLSPVVTQRVPLEAGAVNRVLDDLDAFRAPLRTVITDTVARPAS
jgi:propanol-preferring alcohol dehydrogenase